MDLKNKKVVFLGDSITFGSGTHGEGRRYTDVFAKNTGAEIFNYGIGGTRIARQKTPYNERYDNFDFISRVDDMNSEADIVVVFGGTNDFGHGDAPLGTMSDRDVYTFYGAMHTLICKLIDKYPSARLVFMTPMHRLSEDKPEIEYNGVKKHLKQYVDIIREVCEYYSVPVLDLYKNSGINPISPLHKELYMPDGLHPNNNGALRIAKMLEAFLLSLEA